MSEKDTKSYAMFLEMGDAIADVLEQMLRGHWKDDHDHPVGNNIAMRNLNKVLGKAIEFRAEVDPEGEAS